jgi:hypothetical protein
MQPEGLLGHLAFAGGLSQEDVPVSAEELVSEFSWKKLKKQDIYLNIK